MKNNLYKGKILGTEKYITGYLIGGEQPYIVGEVVDSTEEYINLEYWWPVERGTIKKVKTKKAQKEISKSEPMKKNIFNQNLDTPEEKIKASIEYKKRLFIEYKDKNFNKSKRVIEPFTFKNDKILAYDPEKGGVRSFNIAGIKEIKLTNEDFVKREEDDEE